MMKKIVETDIVIVGGGVAGLWLLNRLRQLGFSVILLESDTLGGGQTHMAQGIIHGGMKFALQGVLTTASQTIADMPKIWEQCLQGAGEINLSQVPILSENQYLWTTNVLTGKLAGFFAKQALQGTVQTLARKEFPDVFHHPQFKGQVYALAERVIDVYALIRELVKPNQDVIFKIDRLHEDQLQLNSRGGVELLEVQAAPSDLVQIKARKYIFTAGGGNEFLTKKLNNKEVAMQRRPLHMLLAKTNFSHSLYAHCLGMSAAPRISITSHTSYEGKTVWYLGGQIAEEGVKRDPEAQIQAGKEEMKKLFPWLDFASAEWASFLVDRAEALQANGKRPDGPYVKEIENLMVAWPTKLAFAPALADEIIACLKHSEFRDGIFDTRALRMFPMPCIAKPIWDELL